MSIFTTKHNHQSNFTGWFKVLSRDGQSTHGGQFEWPLPVNGNPGSCSPVEEVQFCNSGYHLTRSPILWWQREARLFVAEYVSGLPVEFERHGACTGTMPDKICCGSVRLIEEVTANWTWLPMFPDVALFLYLSGNLNKEMLKRYQFSNMNLQKASLCNANLSGLKMCGCSFSYANLHRANFKNCDLRYCDFRSTVVHEANFDNAKLDDAITDYSGYRSNSNSRFTRDGKHCLTHDGILKPTNPPHPTDVEPVPAQDLLRS